ncbi:MAG: GNAT family N-acetyltransferase [Planctomycetota bacterium]
MNSANPELRFVAIGPKQQAALEADAQYAHAMARQDWPRLGERLAVLIGQAPVNDVAESEGMPDGYVVFDTQREQAVGSCGFKAPPNESETVEIAYFTYPGHAGRGVATAMANHLVALADGQPTVRRVIAHTMPEPSASTRVLEKTGFTRVGEVDDPDDGCVWRWERRKP